MNPYIGKIVWYQMANGDGVALANQAAVITYVFDDGSVNLCIFSGLRNLSNVLSGTKDGTWADVVIPKVV